MIVQVTDRIFLSAEPGAITAIVSAPDANSWCDVYLAGNHVIRVPMSAHDLLVLMAERTAISDAELLVPIGEAQR